MTTPKASRQTAAASGIVPAAKPFRRRATWMFALAGVLLILGYAARICFFSPPVTLTELPEIPTVNLEGADPAIAKVITEAHTALKQHLYEAGAWGRLGMLMQAHGFSDAAQTCYRAAGDLQPSDDLWPYLRGYLYRHGPGGPDAALPFFQLAASRRGSDSIARLRLAETLLELGRFDEADTEYRLVLSAAKDDPVAILGLGKLALARRQYRQALEHLQAVAGSPLTQHESCEIRAGLYDRLGDRTAAELERQRLGELPEDALRSDDPLSHVFAMEVGVRVQLAHAEQLMDQNRINDLMVVVEDAVHHYPESFEAWAALGNARGMAGDPAGAERAIRKSIQLAPRNSDGWLSLGNLQIWQQRHTDAAESIQKAIDLNPKNGPAYFSLGECRQKLGDVSGAQEAYRLTLQYFPNHPQARERLEKPGSKPE